jgi:hypothetical protein
MYDVRFGGDGNIMTEDEKLYTNNTGRKSFQWEIWSMCNNLCDFCYLGRTNRSTDKDRQMKSLNDCFAKIKTLDFEKYNNISYIGGDFFQGQLVDKEVHDTFMDLMRYTAQLYLDKKIGSIWITVSLTLGDNKDLYEMMDMFDKMDVRPVDEFGASGLWLCTSYDSTGRFHTPASENNWKFHMKNLHEKYPWVKLNTTCILQTSFIQNYLDGKWSPKEFMKEYHTTLFYKQPGTGFSDVEFRKVHPDTNPTYALLPEMKRIAQETIGRDFFPPRELFIKFLSKYADEDLDTYDKLFNIKYRSDELHRNFNSMESDFECDRVKDRYNETTDEAAEVSPCGHLIEYCSYIDSQACMICDRNAVLESKGLTL